MATANPELVANGVVTNGGPPDDEVELLRGSVQAGVVAQYAIAFAAAVGLIYLFKPELVTVLVATLLAFALEPMVLALARVQVPRPVGAAIALLLLLGLSVALVFFFYNRAIDSMEELPRFSATIREDMEKVQARADQIETSTRSVLPGQTGKKPIPVQCRNPTGSQN
jgi:predicted PurR-regulated permease PerM